MSLKSVRRSNVNLLVGKKISRPNEIALLLDRASMFYFKIQSLDTSSQAPAQCVDLREQDKIKTTMYMAFLLVVYVFIYLHRHFYGNSYL